MGIKAKLGEQKGQMTVEWAVAFPVFVVVAVVAVNALTFFSECAEFDRVARNAMRAYAAAPAYEQGVEQSCAQIKSALEQEFSASNMETTVSAEGVAGGKTRFVAILRYEPTLFGLGMKSEVFGVTLPRLEHRTQLVLEMYKPGVLF